MAGISPKVQNKPVISSPLLNDDLQRASSLHTPNHASTGIRRTPKCGVRRSQTISQVFDFSSTDFLSGSPLATAVFTGSEKPLTSKNFLNRHLKTKSSFSSLSNISFRGPSLPATPRPPNKEPGFLKVGITFRDLHTCLSAEYAFISTKPLALNGRYLIHKGGLKLSSEKDSLIYVFLFNDCLVYGSSIIGEPKDLSDQKILPFSESRLANTSETDFSFEILCSELSHKFTAFNFEDYEKWTSVIKNVTTFYCTLSERKAKEDYKTHIPVRTTSIASSTTLYDSKSSRRSSFYNTLKDLVGTFI